MSRRDEVDDILAAALDDLEDEIGDTAPTVPTALPTAHQETSPAPAPMSVVYGPAPPPPHSGSADVAALEDAMAQLLRAGEALGATSTEQQSGGRNSGGQEQQPPQLDLDGAERALDELVSQMQLDGDFGQLLREELGDLGEGGERSAADGGAGASPAPKSAASGSESEHPSQTGAPATNASPARSKGGEGGASADVDRAVKSMLSNMAKPGSDDDAGLDDFPDMDHLPNRGDAGGDLMESMMKEMSALGASGGADDVVEGMMRQLLSKELMYDPMKSVCDRFPEWLAENKGDLSQDEYEKYGTQYQYFQRLVHVYETDPDNYARLMELMQDIQEYGQPPAEIIKELAPGLEFGDDGMPNMDGGGMMPGMPPFPPGMDGEECSIM